MISLYDAIALLTAGMSLVTGIISIASGLHRNGEKLDLIFGIMGLSLFVFFLIPPIGFILVDKAPYSWNILLKRVFNFGFSALLPWFICQYTSCKNKLFPAVVSAFVVITYFVMFSTKVDSPKPLWAYFVLFSLALTSIFGFYAGAHQWKYGNQAQARWFLAAMAFYVLFFVLTFINQVGDNYFGKIFGTKLFFPLNLFPIAFIVIMSLRLSKNIFEKYRLEKDLRTNDEQWNRLVQNMNLVIVELDTRGGIKALNSYALKLLGYTDLNDLLGKNWFDCCLPKDEITSTKELFSRSMEKGQSLPSFTGNILCKDGGLRILSWTNVFVYKEAASITGTMSVGIDITEQENAIEEARILKDELSKENLMLEADINPETAAVHIIGNSEALTYAIQKAKQVAGTNVAVLLLGETGVGKELFADLIHRSSYRKDQPLVKLNCAALPPELIESELFGHEKGAFTGALNARKGRFEMADGGTIFLDEIGELPVSLQPKLLRVLQNGEFERIGGQKTIKVDVRVVSATNRNLEAEIKAGNFREDLFYRLNVFPITIPSLRNRKEDIPLLVGHFVKILSLEHQKTIENISTADMNRLMEYSWPGNIRELINVIERSIIASSGNTLRIDWKGSAAGPSNNGSSSSSIEEVEKAHILKMLIESHWKISGEDGAADKLKLHPNTLRSRMKKLNIKRSEA